jgi:hypothetical protein
MAHDPKIESWLTRNGYAWEFVPDHPIALIDLREADENPARLTRKLDTVRATHYGCNMIDGDEFPAVLLHEMVGKRLKHLLNGRHRTKGALEADRTTFDAIVVREADPYRIDVLLRFSNCLEGDRPTETDNLIQIAEMRAKYPDKGPKDLAKIAGLSMKAVDNYLKLREVEDRADDLGIGTIFRNERIFKPAVKLALQQITNLNNFLATAQLIAKHEELQGGNGTSLAKEVQKCTTEKAVLKLLMDRDKELTDRRTDRERKRMRAPSSKATKLVGLGRGVNSLTEGGIQRVHLAGLGGLSELQRAKAVISTARDRLDSAEEELDRLIEEAKAEAEFVAGARKSAPSSPHAPPP